MKYIYYEVNCVPLVSYNSCRICETDSCARVVDTVSATYLSGSNVVRCNLNNITFDLSGDTPSVDLVLQVRINDFVIDNPNNTRGMLAMFLTI